MIWIPYQIVFRLKSPLHVGCGKIGNLQRTRPYITGRSIWGALTERLTRRINETASDSQLYQEVGYQLQTTLLSTYFYTAIAISSTHYATRWPWANPAFDHQFLGSYASTSLQPGYQSAEDSTLHEVEFIAPHTNEVPSQTVYFKGYIFAHNEAPDNWQEALNYLQIGGERGYGWGQLILHSLTEISTTNTSIFDNISVTFTETGPRLALTQDTALLAHTHSTGLSATGNLEPLVGREWDTTTNRFVGQQLTHFGTYFQPGATLNQATTFVIKPFGIWETVQ